MTSATSSPHFAPNFPYVPEYCCSLAEGLLNSAAIVLDYESGPEARGHFRLE